MTSIGSPNPNFQPPQLQKTKSSKDTVDSKSSKQEPKPQGTLSSFLKFVDTFTRPFRHSETSLLANASFKKVSDLFLTPLPHSIKDIIHTIESKFTDTKTHTNSRPTDLLKEGISDIKPLLKNVDQHIQALIKETEVWKSHTTTLPTTTKITHSDPKFLHTASTQNSHPVPESNTPAPTSTIPLSMRHLFEPQATTMRPTQPQTSLTQTQITQLTTDIASTLNVILSKQNLPITPITIPISNEQLTPFASADLSSLPNDTSKTLKKEVLGLASIHHSAQPEDTTHTHLATLFTAMLSSQQPDAVISPIFSQAAPLTDDGFQSLTQTVLAAISEKAPSKMPEITTLISTVLSEKAPNHLDSFNHIASTFNAESPPTTPVSTQNTTHPIPLDSILSSLPPLQSSEGTPTPKEILTHVIDTIPDPIIQTTVLDQLLQLAPTQQETTLHSLLINPATDTIDLPTPLLEQAITQLPIEQSALLLREINNHDTHLFSSLVTTTLHSTNETLSTQLPLALLLHDVTPSFTKENQLFNTTLPLLLETAPEKATTFIMPLITSSIMLESDSFKTLAKDLFVTILDTTPEQLNPLFSSITSFLSEHAPEKLSLFLDAVGTVNDSMGMIDKPAITPDKDIAPPLTTETLPFEAKLNELSTKERPIALQFINLVTAQDSLDPTTSHQFITQGLSLIDNLDSHTPSRHVFQLGLHEIKELGLKSNELKHALMSLAQFSNSSTQLKNDDISQLFLTLLPQLTQKSETTPSALAGLRGLAMIAKNLPNKSEDVKTAITSTLSAISTISEGKVLNHSIFALGRLLTNIPEKSQPRFLNLMSSLTEKESVIFTLKLSNLSSRVSNEKLMDLIYTFEHLQDLNKISSKEILKLVSLFSKQHNIEDVNDEIFLLSNSTAILEKTLNPELLEKNKLLLNELSISTMGASIFAAEDVKIKKLMAENARQLKGLLLKQDGLTKAYLAFFGGVFTQSEIDDVTGGFSDWKSLLARVAEHKKEEEKRLSQKNKEHIQKERSEFLLKKSSQKQPHDQ